MVKNLILNGKHLVGVECNNKIFYLGDKVDTQEHKNVSIGSFELVDEGGVFIRYSIGNRNPRVFVNSITKSKGAVKFKNTTVITLEEMIKKKVAAKKPALEPKVKTVVVKEESKTKQSIKVQEIEDKILKSYPKVRITILKKRKETLYEFIYRFFNEWNHEKDTIVIDTKEVQTAKSRRRSLGDIFMICKYYYPNVTLLEVAKILYVDIRKPSVKFTSSYVMRSSKCSTIGRMVFYIGSSSYAENSTRDEFGLDYSKWKEEIEKEW